MNVRHLEPRRREGGSRATAVAAAAPPRLVQLPTRQAPAPSKGVFRRVEDCQVLQMSRAYAQQGGFISGDEVAWRMRSHWEQPISTLAKWIVRREIVNVEWHSQFLIPMFQFTGVDMALRPVVRGVLAELVGVFDDWEIAAWFAQPNPFARDERPVDLVGIDDDAILQAARADRFVAAG